MQVSCLCYARPSPVTRRPAAKCERRRRFTTCAMSKSVYFVGLDVGTQSTKALVFDQTVRETVARGSVGYSVDRGPGGRAEQDPAVWVEAVKGALEEALDGIDASKVKGIGVSGQQHGFVPLDKDGKVIRPAKLWCDVETAEEAKELSHVFDTTLVPSFTATKILWLKRQEPNNFARLAHVLLPHDYINYYLTGNFVMEAGDASGTGVFDPINRCWDEQRMGAIDPALRLCFPDLIGPQDRVGTVRPEVAQELGLPPDVFVSAGGGDNMMSALGAGAVKEGSWVVSLGTSGTLFGPSNTPVLDPTCTICPFADATGKWLPLLCTINCAGVPQEIRHAFGLKHEQMTALAATVPPGCNGTTFLPYLGGERTPNWPHATGAILGLRPGSLSPGVLYRAALEGATFSLLAGMARLKSYGLEANELRVVGGGSNNKLWRRILADAFQLPLRFPQEPESAALGAALQAAAVHSGVSVEQYVLMHPPPMEEEVVQPNHLAAGAYQKAFEEFCKWGEYIFASGGCVA